MAVFSAEQFPIDYNDTENRMNLLVNEFKQELPEALSHRVFSCSIK